MYSLRAIPKIILPAYLIYKTLSLSLHLFLLQLKKNSVSLFSTAALSYKFAVTVVIIF